MFAVTDVLTAQPEAFRHLKKSQLLALTLPFKNFSASLTKALGGHGHTVALLVMFTHRQPSCRRLYKRVPLLPGSHPSHVSNSAPCALHELTPTKTITLVANTRKFRHKVTQSDFLRIFRLSKMVFFLKFNDFSNLTTEYNAISIYQKIRIHMDFPENNKFTYIIGNNGSGKSRALEKNADAKHNDNHVVVIASGASDKFRYRPKPKLTTNGSYRYLGNRTVGNGTHNGTLAANAVLLYKEISDANQSQPFLDFLEKIGFDKKIGIGHRNLKRSSIPLFETTELTTQYIRENSVILEMKAKPFEAVFYKTGSPFKFSELSTGEQYIINTALKIISSSKENVIYYIDEPEVSLHVEWQIKWPERFHPLLNLNTGIRAFIATHSPVIISSALQNGGKCYLLKSNTLHVIEDEKFDLEELLFKDFNTLTPNSKHLYSEISEIVNDAVAGLNMQSQTVGAAARAAVEQLGAKIERVSKVSNDTAGIAQTFKEFKTAINELLSIAQS
jgi:predicted ATPase